MGRKNTAKRANSNLNFVLTNNLFQSLQVMSTKGKGRSRKPEHLEYANALPLLPTPSKTLVARSLNTVFRIHLVSIENPRCVAIFDAPTRSVWVVNARDREILWKRGFFGKGNLSRSEPSWLNRRVNQLVAARSGTKGAFVFVSLFVQSF